MYMYVCISVRGAGGCSYQSISPAGARAQQQTRRTPLLLSIDGTDRHTDRQTDGRTLIDRFMSLAAYYADRVTAARIMYMDIISRQVASLRAGLMPMIM